MTRNCAARARGFTLVELLVVIAIIGVLVSLLLPAVQAARESSRRSQCLNNLRQIAIGCHNFQSANGSFPTAGGCVEQFLNTAELAKPAYGYEGAGWMYQILPFIEQRALYDLRRGTTAANSGFVATGLVEKKVSMYNCPSRDERVAIAATDIYALPDYAGVMANWNDEGWQGFAWQTSAAPRAERGHPRVDRHPGEGRTGEKGIAAGDLEVSASRFQVDRRRFVQHDPRRRKGCGRQVLHADQARRRGRTGRCMATSWAPIGPICGCSARFFPTAFPTKPRRRAMPLKADTDSRGVLPDPTEENGFGSAHPGVLCSVWGDGSTRTISMSADLLLLDRLGKRADQNQASYTDL